MKNSGILWFVIYLVFGLYFLNSGIGFVNLPGFFQEIDKWIIVVGGILIIIGGFNHFRVNRRYKY